MSNRKDLLPYFRYAIRHRLCDLARRATEDKWNVCAFHVSVETYVPRGIPEIIEGEHKAALLLLQEVLDEEGYYVRKATADVETTPDTCTFEFQCRPKYN